jgi:hypothetical protein
MATFVLDTYKAILRLKEAGFEEIKAEAIVQSLQDVDLQGFATKQDIAELKADLFKWLIPILLGQVAVFSALVKFLIKV